jgi:hypothetical protein
MTMINQAINTVKKWDGLVPTLIGTLVLSATFWIVNAVYSELMALKPIPLPYAEGSTVYNTFDDQTGIVMYCWSVRCRVATAPGVHVNWAGVYITQ